MSRLITWCISIFLLTPLFASADPVRVHAEASGTMRSDNLWLWMFTNVDRPPGDAIPFTLTLDTQLDPDSAGYQEISSSGTEASIQRGFPTTMTLTIGGQTYEIADDVSFALHKSSSSFHLVFDFAINHYHQLSLDFWGPAGSFSGPAISPLSISSGGTMRAHGGFVASSLNPDASGMWSSDSTLTSASASVMAVPEPTTFGMMLAGLLVVMGARSRLLAKLPAAA